MKNAVVWGASGGIGQEILAKLKTEDWRSVAIARDTSEMSPLADYTFDTRLDDPNSIEQTLYLVLQEVSSIDF